MAKTSAKNAEILINGYKLSTYATAYSVETTAGEVEVTGFTDGTHNYIPGLPTGAISTDMLWSADTDEVHDALGALPTGQITILPETYAAGVPTVTMPFMSANYTPAGSPADAIRIGSIKYLSYGADAPARYGWALAHGTVTDTTIGETVTDPTGAARTSACGAALHVWMPTDSDTYAITVQHSANGSAWSDLITFAADGTSRTAELQTLASGNVNKYWRAVATRTGSAGDPLGFTVTFFFK